MKDKIEIGYHSHNGSKWYEFSFLNGLRHHKRFWHSNKCRMFDITYKQGMIHGVEIHFLYDNFELYEGYDNQI